jgi:hypothetical protein
MSEHFRALIAGREALVIGKTIIDGQHALILRLALNLPPGLPLPSIQIEWWVNATTYVPLRNDNTGIPPIIFTWLPRTTSNLAKTRLVVPAGFRHLVQPSASEGSVQLTGVSGFGQAPPLCTA